MAKQSLPQVLVIFGAAGDLTERKLIPALFHLFKGSLIDRDCHIIGVSRTKYTDESIREHYSSVLSNLVSDPEWSAFIKRVFYQPFDARELASYESLKNRIEELAGVASCNKVFYLATAPQLFSTIAENLSRAGLAENSVESGSSRLVIEKPFGNDLESARALNKTIRQFWGEKQIFRIDHYLGKEIVQNILVFRFANSIFEPLWNRQHIDHIQISVCESIGVDDRADYFDNSGITRDIVQNHLLQMLSLLCIEAPSSLSDADSIRSEKVKVLKSMRRLSEDQVRSRTVRAQYLASQVDDKAVVGYQDLKGVKHGSLTETYVAMQLEVDNWRWSGVPIYVRAGKCLSKRITTISIFFKTPPLSGFQVESNSLQPNVLVIQVQPNEGISLRVNSKVPGLQMKLKPVDMDFSYRGAFSQVSADAYERLLLDVFKGDATLFTRDDEIEQAWELVDPVLNTWQAAPYIPLYYYKAGSWGPKEADLLLAKNGHQWLNF